MGNSHPCPRCGQSTTGAWSEGGLRWAICEDCMTRDREKLDEYVQEMRDAETEAREKEEARRG